MRLDQRMDARCLRRLDERAREGVIDEGVERRAPSLLAHIAGAATSGVKTLDPWSGPPETRGDDLAAFDPRRHVVPRHVAPGNVTPGNSGPRELRRREGSHRQHGRDARPGYSHSMVAGGFDEMS